MPRTETDHRAHVTDAHRTDVDRTVVDADGTGGGTVDRRPDAGR